MIARPRIGSRDSILNEPLAVDAPLADTSADWSARLARQCRYSPSSSGVTGPYAPPFNVAINTSTFSIPVYTMPLDTPRIRVVWRQGGVERDNAFDHGLSATLLEVPMPNRLLMPPGDHDLDHQVEARGSDRSCVIVCGQEMWELFGLTHDDAEVNGWRCSYAAYVANAYSWSGVWPFWGMRACGLAATLGMVTIEDTLRGLIDHPLGIALPVVGATGTGTNGHVAPATRNDNGSNATGATELLNADRVPEGARFRLPAAFDVDGFVAASATPADKSTLRAFTLALRDYGVFVIDGAGVAALYAEDYRTVGSPYNPHSVGPARPLSWIGASMPWESVVQVAPRNPLTGRRLVRQGGALRLARRF